MKKKITYILIALLMFIPNIVLAAQLDYVACGNSKGIPAPVPQLISIVYTLLIVGTPIILIIFSIVALLKAITGGSQDDINKAKNKVIKKFIAAALVFFVAGVVQFAVVRASDASEKQTVVDCIRCMLYNNGCMPSDGGEDVYQATTRPGESEQQVSNPTGNTNNNNSNNNSNNNTQPSNGTTYVSSKNNIKYNIYYQNDSSWGNIAYPGEFKDAAQTQPKTISYKGCMITAVAVVVSSYDSTFNPETCFNSGHRHNHPSSSIPTLTSSGYSCKMLNWPSADTVKSHLKNGDIVIVKVYGGSNGNSTYTSSQHYMALLDINSDGNQVYVGNGYSSSSTGKTGWHSASAVLTSVATAEVCTPSQSLISKYS